VTPADRKWYAQLVFSGAILGVCLYIVVSGKYDEDYAKWAFGMIGVIIGYWLK
jgi:hypothetical protein